jgi:transcriptional regulator with XRE-family HTH domain
MKNAPIKLDPDSELDLTRLKRVTRPRKGTERILLRTLREGMGKTQLEVARAIGSDQGEVSRIERRPDALVSTVRKYAAALGARCEVAFVFPGGQRVLIAEPEPMQMKPYGEIERTSGAPSRAGGGALRGVLRRGEMFAPPERNRESREAPRAKRKKSHKTGR